MIDARQAKIALKKSIKVGGKEIIDLIATDVPHKRALTFQRPFQPYHACPEANRPGSFALRP